MIYTSGAQTELRDGICVYIVTDYMGDALISVHVQWLDVWPESMGLL